MAGTKIGDLFVKLGMDLSDFDKGLEDAKRTLSSVGREFTSMGTQLSLALTAPLAAIAGFSLKSSAGFESAMNKVEGLLKDFSNSSPQYLSTFKGEMESLSKLAIKLGADTQFSAKQAADAMGELAAAGFNSTQILKGMEGVLSLAAVGQMKLAEAAEIAAAVVGGFGISAEHISRVADVLAKASSVSAASVQDLGYAFKYIGPVAKAAGVSFNETAAALSLLANAGIKGESAGTALRNLFQDILKPSTQAAEVMKNLGIVTTDAAGKLLPLADLLDQFNKKGLSLSDGFKIWGARFSDVIPLLQKGGDELRKITKEMENSEGSAKKMADTFRKGLAGMWEEFTGSLETLGIALGKIMQPVVEPIVKWLTQLTNKVMQLAVDFKTLDPAIQAAVGGLLAVAAAIGPVLLAIGGISSALSALVGAAGSGVAALSSLARAGASTVEFLAGVPAMVSNITLAVQGGMIGALTMAEKALLGLGMAAAGAASLFAGWQLGSWLRNNIPLVRDFGNAVGDMITRIPGMQAAVDRLSGATSAMQRAQADGAHIVKMWEAQLKAAGISVSQGSMTIEQYTNKLRGMMQELIKTKDAHASVFGDASSALNAIRTLQGELAKVASKATIGITDKGETKAAIIEVENAMKAVHAIQLKINESVKAGKIDKKGQVDLEKQLADAMSFAKSVMSQLGAETTKTTAAMGGLTKSKQEAAKAAKQLLDNQEKLANFSMKLQDVLENIPKSYEAFGNVGRAMEGVPKELEKQARALEVLKEKLADFRREIAKAPAEIQGAMKGMTFELDYQTKQMEGWLQHMVNARKGMAELEKGITEMTRGLGDLNFQGIKLPEWLSQLSGEAAWADMAAPVISLKEAMTGLGLESSEALQKAADRARDFYEVIEASGESLIVKKKALLEYLELQIKADEAAGKSTEALRQRAAETANALEAMGVKMKGFSKETDEQTEAFKRQISTIWNDFGKGVTDAILKGKDLGEVFTKVFQEMKTAVMRFVVESIVEGLQKELKKAILETGNLGEALTNLAKKFKEMFTFGGGTPTPSIPGGGKNPVPGTGGSGGVGGIAGGIGIVTDVVNAVTGVLGYLQGRRMEQDIGRIEVTSRGILNQTIALQETFNTYLPNLLNLQLLIPIKEILWEMLTGVSTVAQAAAEGASAAGTPLRPGESGSGRGGDPGTGRGGGDQRIKQPIEEILETLPDVANSFRELEYSTTETGRAMAGAGRNLDRLDARAERTARGVGRLGDRTEVTTSRLDRMQPVFVDTSLNFLGLNIVTKDLNKTLDILPDKIEPPFRKLEEAAEAISDFERNIWSTSKTLNSASFMMGQTIDGVAEKAKDLLTPTFTGTSGFSFANPVGNVGAGLTTPTAPYGPGSPGYRPPSFMMYPAGQQPDFNVTIVAPSADGRAMGNAFVNSLRAHGVDL